MTGIQALLAGLRQADPLSWSLLVLAQCSLLLLCYPAVERRASRLLGRAGLAVRYVLFLGTVIHELSHVLACFLLLVPVGRTSLFGPERDGEGGWTLGYVEHSRVGPLRDILIGLAPLLGCTLATYLGFLWAAGLPLLSPLGWDPLVHGLGTLASDPFSFRTLGFLYLLSACALAGTPSRADLSSAPLAVAVLAALGGILFASRSVLASLPWDGLSSRLPSPVPSLVLVSGALAFELAVLSVVLALLLVLGRRPRRA